MQQANAAYSTMALPTQDLTDRQQLIPLTYTKKIIKINYLRNWYYFTVYLDRQTTAIAAKKTKIEEN